MGDILLAFSGGIDSCAAVEILRGQGWRVHLLTIDMIGDDALIEQATECAQRLNAPLHIVEAKELFAREIIKNFIEEYMSGRTPAPCTRCNPLIKWQILSNKADELGIYHIATGHYFRIAEWEGRHYVARAVDPAKDQSYYLWGLSSEILKRAVTPMGSKIKAEIKMESGKWKWKNGEKKESMGVCFLRGAHYSDLLASHCGAPREGDIIDINGEVVARHNGIAHYTIGQRRGEGIPEGYRVVEITGSKNQLRIGLNEELYSDTLHIGECHFISLDELCSSDKIEVMVRGIGRNPKGCARLTTTPTGATIKLLDDRAWALAPGQPVVLYIGERVVGGGYLL